MIRGGSLKASNPRLANPRRGAYVPVKSHKSRMLIGNDGFSVIYDLKLMCGHTVSNNGATDHSAPKQAKCPKGCKYKMVKYEGDI